MTSWPHNHYEPWHIVTITDESAEGLRLDVKHPKNCGQDSGHCSTASHVKHYGLDDGKDASGDESAPVVGTYRVRYWWDNYEPDGDGLEVEACAPDSYHSDCGRPVAECDCRIVAVLGDIRAERFRQIAKWGVQHHPDGTSADDFNLDMVRMWKNLVARDAVEGTTNWTSLLFEEAYEASAETDPAKLRAELLQVAAVAVAWVEDLDSRTKGV